MTFGPHILHMKSHGGARVYERGDTDYFVLPETIDFLDDPAIAISICRDRRSEGARNLRLRARTALHFPTELQQSVKRGIKSFTNTPAHKSISLSLPHPLKVVGSIDVPPELKKITDWTFDVSPMGLWPGLCDITIQPEVAAIFLDWLENVNEDISISYKATFEFPEETGVSFSHQNQKSVARGATQSTQSKFEILKAQLAHKPKGQSQFTITSTVPISPDNRRTARSILN